MTHAQILWGDESASWEPLAQMERDVPQLVQKYKEKHP